MGPALERVRESVGGVLKTAATLLLLGLMAAAGERSLAPFTMERPDDRTPADVRATDAAYRYAASYATEPEMPPKDF
jgi:hypothetical protein